MFQVVPKDSAILPGYIPIGIHGNHMDMTKFDNEDEPGFIAIAGELRRWIKELTLLNGQQCGTQYTNATKHSNQHWVVPRPVSKLFTGRTELVLQVQAALRCDYTFSTTRQRRFVITGMGGLGKSEVCLKVADLVREEFWAVFWVNVDKPATAENDFIAIAKLLGRSAESISEALQVLASIKKNWLLILDNADDPKFDYQNYFPSGTHGAVIMTSRVSECKRYSPDAFKALGGLEEQESKELLLKVAGLPQEEWSSFESQAIEVVCLLGSHTLALIQAGAYIARGHCRLSEYPGVFKRQRNRLLTYRPQQAQSRYCDVYATFEASADILKQSQTEAAQDALHLLDILSILASSALPLQVFKEAWNGSRNVISINGDETSSMDALSREHILRLPAFVIADGDEWDPFRLLEACALLESLSLVTRYDSQADGLYGLSMHPLTHAWAKNRQTSIQQSTAWLVTGCVIAFSKSSSPIWQTQEKLLVPHIQSYLDIIVQQVLLFGPTPVVIPILIKCGWILQDMRLDLRLKQLLDDMFEELGKDSLAAQEDTLALHDLQAGSLLDLGKSKQAVTLLEQVVKIRETALAEDHPDRLVSQHTLAIAYKANGQVKDAVILLEHVVKIRETTLAEDHPYRLASQHELAIAYEANGQVKEAVALLEHVVKIQDITLAKDHPYRLASQHTLAFAYEANGQVKKAVALLEHVAKIKENTLAEDHPSRLASQHALAIAYEANGQIKEAVSLLEHVVKFKETTLAEDHPSRLASQHALAVAYEANKQVKEAVSLLEHVVKIQDITLAVDHPDRLASQHALATAYEADGQVKEAVALLEHVVNIRETTLAEDHPDRIV
ncbi:hypothetical protein B0O99DRAFT_520880 [Bisporella sp. PMI_857]|nr:hypothetical protein B0O99DRAFT_520880 [Bisporella sp. PMI_857]